MGTLGGLKLGRWCGVTVAFPALVLMVGVVAAETKSPAYVGKWATTAAQCRLPSSDINAPIVMTRRTYDQFESHCDLSNIVGGKRIWTAKSRCVTNGDVSRPRLTIFATAKGLSLKWSNQQFADNNVRCR